MAISAEQIIGKFKQALEDKWGYIFGQSGTLWTQSDQNQKIAYMEKNYGPNWKKSADAKKDKYYNSASLGSKWIGHHVADCSGMFVWAYRQYGLSIAHGSTSIYKAYCGQKGKLTSDLKKTLKPGAAVFTGDTEGDHPHVGLYVGNGKCIEAAGVDAGVCTSNLSAGKWKWYGYLTAVNYGSTQPEDPVEDVNSNDMPTLRKGAKGEATKLLQTKLAEFGYDLGKWGIDGDFGSATEAAVKKFQKANGLTQDGIVGKNTWGKLLQESKPVEKKYTVTIPGLTKTQADEIKTKYPDATAKEE